jgi:hypothetical protein
VNRAAAPDNAVQTDRVVRATPTTEFPESRRAPPAARLRGFTLVDGDGPRFGTMIGLVAVVVATVILVFFGIGYALGRLFL